MYIKRHQAKSRRLFRFRGSIAVTISLKMRPFYPVIGAIAMFSSQLTVADELIDGQAVFESVCAGCHKTPLSLQTPAAELVARLESGSVRQHRFELTKAEITLVTSYIKSVRP